MPQSGYSLGRDVALDIVTADGVLRPSEIVSFNSKPKINKEEVTALNGNTDELLIPKGWEGEIEVARKDATLDSYWAAWEDNYYNGIDNGKSTITETITESDGTTTVWRYQGVQLSLTDAGKREGDKKITQTMNWTARRRIQVA